MKKSYRRINALHSAGRAYERGERHAFDHELAEIARQVHRLRDAVDADVQAPHVVRPLMSMVAKAVSRNDVALLKKTLAVCPPCLDYCALAVQCAEVNWRPGFDLLRDLAADQAGFILGMPLVGAFGMGDAKLYHHAESDWGHEEHILEDFVDEALARGASYQALVAFMRRHPGRAQGVTWPAIRRPRLATGR